MSTEQIARKNVMLRFLESEKSGYRLYYVSGERDVEFAQDDNYGWIQPWVSVARSNDDGTMDSLTIGFPKESVDSSVCVVEFGIRKNPGKSLSETDNHGWWHKNSVKTKYLKISDLKEEEIRDIIGETFSHIQE